MTKPVLEQEARPTRRWQRIPPEEPLDPIIASLVDMGATVVARWRVIEDALEPTK